MTETADRPSPPTAAPTDPGVRRAPARKIALLGLPNSGKSQIFNRLTGQYAVVANYPMTTVTAERKPALIGLHWYEVVDTPGLHGLTIHAQEELEVRELLYRERPDVIVQCVDANRLQASLSLTADLLELEIPLVVALNAIDETTRRGVEIDARQLGQRLGVQVVELVAAKGLGTGQLKRAITAATSGTHRKRYGEPLEKGLERLTRFLPADTPYPRKTALTLAVGDPFLLPQLGRWNPGADLGPLERELAAVRASLKANPITAAAAVRNRWIDAIAAEVIRTRPAPRSDWSRRVAEISRHPVLGAPVLLGVMGICFLLVVQVANRLTDLLNAWVWSPVAAHLDGVLPPGLWHGLLLGEFGLLSFGVANALLTVLPILSVFFFAYSLIEDTGYIPNMGVMTHRALRKLGLSGASIMPLVLACGCKTMATMTTRGLSSRKERLIAVFLIASSVPCAAQTGLHLAILGRTGL
ncbi:MAG TPA: ferrous iron transporter B, partial [Deferrisomatales bacterium]|nr:ferrous iron transporter B [Deferrisomatales bacterium]